MLYVRKAHIVTFWIGSKTTPAAALAFLKTVAREVDVYFDWTYEGCVFFRRGNLSRLYAPCYCSHECFEVINSHIVNEEFSSLPEA